MYTVCMPEALAQLRMNRRICGFGKVALYALVGVRIRLRSMFDGRCDGEFAVLLICSQGYVSSCNKPRGSGATDD